VSAPARLVWHRVSGEPVTFVLEGECYVVGRDSACDVVVDEPLVSRLHARLERRGTRWFVVDQGSTNFTRVNGVVVSEWPLAPGDEVRFARARCVFHAAETQSGEAPGEPGTPGQRKAPE